MTIAPAARLRTLASAIDNSALGRSLIKYFPAECGWVAKVAAPMAAGGFRKITAFAGHISGATDAVDPASYAATAAIETVKPVDIAARKAAGIGHSVEVC